jgi:hypothetical protein
MRIGKNKVRSRDTHYVVDISTSKHPNAKMLIDKIDHDDIRQRYKGRITAGSASGKNTHVYAKIRTEENKVRKIHRIVMGMQASRLDIDHINHNTLDNRRCNLRICSRTENRSNSKLSIRNKSGFTGVRWNKKSQKWMAFITSDGKAFCLGRFENKESAIEARLHAEAKHFREFMPEQNKILAKEYGILQDAKHNTKV